MDAGRLDALQKLPALKGPALSIMMALMIAQRPLLAEELLAYTGYSSDKSITRGLSVLRSFRAVVHLGRTRGYMLTPQWQQLLLPLEYDSDDAQKIDRKKYGLNDEIDRKKYDKGEIDRKKYGQSAPHGYGGGGRSIQTDQDQPPTTNHGGTGNRKKYGQPVDNFGDNSADGGEITPQLAAPEITARSGSPEITTVARWLHQAGIAPGSYHWEKILGMGLSESHVKAHVLELLASEEGIPGADDIKSGALIYRLEHNWRPPPMRCDECLQVLRDCVCDGGTNQIPPEYRDIIKR